jgi:hypothetical protein
MKRKTLTEKAHNLRQQIANERLRKRIVYLQVMAIKESSAGRLTQMTRDAVQAALDAWHGEIKALLRRPVRKQP